MDTDTQGLQLVNTRPHPGLLPQEKEKRSTALFRITRTGTRTPRFQASKRRGRYSLSPGDLVPRSGIFFLGHHLEVGLGSHWVRARASVNTNSSAVYSEGCCAAVYPSPSFASGDGIGGCKTHATGSTTSDLARWCGRPSGPSLPVGL